jgi:hypothetical protein
MPSRREAILARLAVVVASVSGLETAARNLDRLPDTKTPSAVMFDGDEEAFENLRATGGAPNAVTMTPSVVVSLGEVPENVGTVTNEWLAKVQKAVLFDSELEQLAGGRTAVRRIPNGGARYVASTNSLSEGRSAEVNLTVHFAITYPFNPAEL